MTVARRKPPRRKDGASKVDRGRDLLYGVLALQLGFVTREQFVEVMALLPHQPERSAAQLFRSRGYVAPAQARALGAVLELELARHGGDAERSMAALEVGPTVANSLTMFRARPAEPSAAPAERTGEGASAIPETIMAEHGPVATRADRYAMGPEIGRGGVGRVVLAVDRDLMGREVAMKLLLPAADRKGRLRERFLEEAQVTSHLQHPNVVSVYELGLTPDGDLYYTMPLVRGKTFKAEVARAHERRADGKVSADEWAVERMRMLSAFQGVCHAIAYAHSRGIVHRDLKPHNVMLGEFGETIVLDWGLAKVLDRTPKDLHDAPTVPGAPADERPTHGSDEELEQILRTLRRRKAYQTLEGSIAGTPAYMAPEQAEGKISEIDERSDVYSLGAVLFEILTGHAPYEGPDAAAVLFRVAAGPTPDPRHVARDVDDDIAAICLKAMSHAKSERYASVIELNRDVTLYTEGAKERARRREQAARLVQQGLDGAARHGARRDDVARLEEQAAELRRQLQGAVPIERKRPLWELEDQATATRHEVATALAEAERCFHKALEWEADNPEARQGLADLYLGQLLRAEAAGDADAVHYHTQLVESYHDGRHARVLRGDGALSIATTPRGAQIHLFRYEERDRRLLPVPWKAPAGWPIPSTTGAPTSAGWYLKLSSPDAGSFLGRTPLPGPVEIPMGSYLLVARKPGFRDTRLPLRIARNAAVSLAVRLYREADIGKDMVVVPGGPFVMGGDLKVDSSLPRQTVELPDFFIGRFPVTAGEYLAYLNALAAADADEARRHAPRRSDGRVLWVEQGGVWSLPEVADAQGFSWSPRQPMVFVTWDDANAYAEWRSRKDGRRYRLPFGSEREKAARGADERWHPFGNHHDPAWCNMVESRMPEPARIGPVGEYPVDESPYGVRDLAGNVFDWCLDLFEEDKVWRTLKGGAFHGGAIWSRSAGRIGFMPTERREIAGFRLVSTPTLSGPRRRTAATGARSV